MNRRVIKAFDDSELEAVRVHVDLRVGESPFQVFQSRVRDLASLDFQQVQLPQTAQVHKPRVAGPYVLQLEDIQAFQPGDIGQRRVRDAGSLQEERLELRHFLERRQAWTFNLVTTEVEVFQ